MNIYSESYVREELLPDARRVFECAGLKRKGLRFEDFEPVAIYHQWLNFWKLGFIPTKDQRGTETKEGFVYSVNSNSLFGPFWCFFQNGRWELYLAND